MNIQVDPGDENPAADALNGVYEKVRPLRPGDRVLDLGAHRGYFALVALQKIGPEGAVMCFEPHPENYRLLCARLKGIPNVTLFNYAAWDDTGTKDLWESVDNSGGHSFTKVDAGQKPEPVKVAVIDVGMIAAQFRPTFIKIDTELSELNILRSLRRWGVAPEHIACEIHNREMWDACTWLLKDYGYRTEPAEFTNYYLYASKL